MILDYAGASACLLVYEWVISLDDEIPRMWSLKWGLPKLIFMLNRYIIRVLLVYVSVAFTQSCWLSHLIKCRCLWIIVDLAGTNKVRQPYVLSTRADPDAGVPHIWLRSNYTTGSRNPRGAGLNSNQSMGHLCAIHHYAVTYF